MPINDIDGRQKNLDGLSTLPLTVPNRKPNRCTHGATIFGFSWSPPTGAIMIRAFADPIDVLLNLQRALDAQTSSGWLQNQTASQGPFPPINVFQQGDDLLAIIELPGVEKGELQIQAKENTIRISGKKAANYPEGSVHRRERVFGEFDRTLSLPIQLDPERIKAEYRDGVLALLLTRAESEKPRTIKIT
jgi:HSP20 family protein